MYNFVIKKDANKYDFTELIKIFLTPEDFRAYTEDEFDELPSEQKEPGQTVYFNDCSSDDKNLIKCRIYSFLSRETGINPPWGILTGVRPVKLTGELFDKLGNEEPSGEAEAL